MTQYSSKRYKYETMPDTLLVTGAAGLLGRRILVQAAEDYHGVGTDLQPTDVSCEFHQADITDNRRVKHLITQTRPDYVIHAAAMTDVDGCETDQKKAYAVNVAATRAIGEACAEIGCRLTYVSTDFVFDGEKGNYTEEDPVNPIGYYGKSKLLGEQSLQELDLDCVIARTSVTYGWHPKNFNFAQWVITSLEQQKPIRIVTDQYGSPTLADNLADMLLSLRDKSGIYHAAGADRISRYDFATTAADVFGLDAGLITPITSGQFPQKAPRPKDSSLNVSKIKNTIDIPPMTCKQGLTYMKHHRP